MLVLTRRTNEKVIITIPPSQEETKVEVSYLRQQGTIVRLGFTAPKEVAIHRQEVYNVIQEAKSRQ